VREVEVNMYKEFVRCDVCGSLDWVGSKKGVVLCEECWEMYGECEKCREVDVMIVEGVCGRCV
jgi:hypothetical protein